MSSLRELTFLSRQSFLLCAHQACATSMSSGSANPLRVMYLRIKWDGKLAVSSQVSDAGG